MANEISFQFSFQVSNGTYVPGPWSANDSYNQNAQGAVGGIITATTTATNVDYGDVTALGYSLWKNLDNVNNVLIGIVVSATFEPFCLLQPGEEAVFRIQPGVTLQVKSSASTVDTQYWILSD